MDINAILEPIFAFLVGIIGQDGIDMVMEYVGQAITFILGLIGV